MVTVPDPEEQDGRDAARRDRSQDTDATFAAIVADWRTEPDAPHWPADSESTRPAEAQEQPPAQPQRTPADSDDDHFQPPEPPPFPVPQPRTIGGVLLVILGVLLLIEPGLLSVGPTLGTPLGLLTISAGIGWLVLGLRGGPPSEGWDDGARL